MIVYFENWTRRYWPTQAEGKEAEKQSRFGGGDAARCEKVDVPTSEGRDALCDFLNNLEDAARNAAMGNATDIVEVDAPKPAAPDVERKARAIEDADEIVDFILNRASVAQTENILGCLGTRFAELAKEKRHG